MGWFFTIGASRAQIIDELTREDAAESFKVIRKSASGNVLWTVEQRHIDGHRWIGCYLLTKAADGWGYKPMDESMGPFYWTCPWKYLQMVPATNMSWRLGVIKYWDKRKRKLRLRLRSCSLRSRNNV